MNGILLKVMIAAVVVIIAIIAIKKVCGYIKHKRMDKEAMDTLIECWGGDVFRHEE